MRGYTLIEVLIALTLFSVFLAGYFAMQHRIIEQAANITRFFYARHELENINKLLSLAKEKQELITSWHQQASQHLPNVKVIHEESKTTLLWGSEGEQTCKYLTIGKNGCVFHKK